MKKTRCSSVAILFAAASFVVIMISCQKNALEKFNPARMFTPTSITVTGGDTAVTLTWPASLYSQGKPVTYTVQVSPDSTFGSPVALTVVTDTPMIKLTDDSLTDKQKYYARVRADSSLGSAPSYWIVSPVFSFVGVQLFDPVQDADIIDNAVILRWNTTPGVTKIVLTPATGNAIQVPVSEADNIAGNKLISGLASGTAYTAYIFVGTKSKGTVSFTTKMPATGANIIDLRGITDPLVLFDTLPQIPSGSTVLLERGMTYDIPSAYIFDRTVTIKSGLGFGAQATLSLSANFDATGNIDSLRFADLTIANNAGAAAYFMNVGHVAVIGKLSIEQCNTDGIFSNSFIRLKTSGDVISRLYINNCVIDSFGISAKYAVFYASGSNNAKIDNIEIHNSTFYSFYYFIRQDGVTTSSLLIDNCTFNDMINQGGYFINYSTVFPPLFTISNSIFGATIDATNANGIKSSGNAQLSNCYATNDCIFSANPITGAAAYPGKAAALFTDPQNGNFTIKDNSFTGKNTAGDPRWR